MRMLIMIAGLMLLTMGGAAVLLSPNGATVPSTGPGTIRAIGAMASPRAAHQANVLPNGQLLITGGCSGSSCGQVLASAELFDPASNAFRSAPEMRLPRASHAAVTLPNGDVLIVGGWRGRAATATAERFDRSSGSFVPAGSMSVARMSPAAVTLDDGRILIAGGEISTASPVTSAELYEPDAGAFVATGSMNVPRGSHVAIALRDGRVLVTGGHRARGEILRSAEIYDPRTGRFAPTGDMLEARHKHAAALLPDGRVLILGGADAQDSRGRKTSTEIFDPATGTFSPGPSMRSPRYKFRDAVVTLPTGAVFVAGGAEHPELWDPELQQFDRVQGELDGVQEFATARLLPDGDVLVLGGYDRRIQPSAAGWRYTPPEAR